MVQREQLMVELTVELTMERLDRRGAAVLAVAGQAAPQPGRTATRELPKGGRDAIAIDVTVRTVTESGCQNARRTRCQMPPHRPPRPRTLRFDW